jgi:hypothetical protein
MRITRLRGGNAQFPEEKDIGDVVVLALGDIFCWDGGMWQLVGGRFIPAAMRDDFIIYVSNGWPDASDAYFDLPTLLDLSVFTNYGPYDTVPADKKFVERFISRVAEVAERCEKNLQAQRSE